MNMECDRCGSTKRPDDWRDEWVALDGVLVCGACQTLQDRVTVLRGMEQILEAAEAVAAAGGCEPPDARFVAMVVRERATVHAQVRTATELEAIGGVR